MAAVTVDLEFLAVGCNRTANAISWGDNGLLAYAAGNGAAVATAGQDSRVLAQLPGDSSRVNCCHWLPSAAAPPSAPPVPAPHARGPHPGGGASAQLPADVLLFGSASGCLSAWSFSRGRAEQWRLEQSLPSAHSAGITAISSTCLPLPRTCTAFSGTAAPPPPSLPAAHVVATVAGDCTVGLWCATWQQGIRPGGPQARLEDSARPAIDPQSSPATSVSEKRGADRSQGGAHSRGSSGPSTRGAGAECEAGAPPTRHPPSPPAAPDSPCLQLELVQRLPVGGRPAQAAALAFVPAAEGGGRRAAPAAGGKADGAAGGAVGTLLLALGGMDGAVLLHAAEVVAAVEVPLGEDAGGSHAEQGASSLAGSPFLFPLQPACRLGGHQDWVRALSFSPLLHMAGAGGIPSAAASRPAGGTGLLLASGSQDRNIRVWRIEVAAAGAGGGEAQGAGQGGQEQGREGGGGAAPAIGADLLTLQVLRELSAGPSFSAGGATWRVELDGLLVGHEDWVHSLMWHPVIGPTGRRHPAPHLPVVAAGGVWVKESAVAEVQAGLPPAPLNPHVSVGDLMPGRPGGGGSGGGDPQGGPSRGPQWQPLRLLSASMDRTVLMWQPESAAGGPWYPDVSLGDITHSALGFFSAVWSPRGDAVFANAFGGSLHLWRNSTSSSSGGSGSSCALEWGEGVAVAGGQREEALLLERSEGEEAEEEDWRAAFVPSGHFAAVADVCWDSSASFLLSVSQDQTARVFAQWVSGASRISPPLPHQPPLPSRPLWCEVARPQVHGHDLKCAAYVPSHRPAPLCTSLSSSSSGEQQGEGAKGTGPGTGAPLGLCYVSGAEEKVLRAFEAPQAFLLTLRHAVLAPGSPLEAAVRDPQGGRQQGGAWAAGKQQPALAAAMSALGLSQKPIFTAGPAAAAPSRPVATHGFDEADDMAAAAAAASAAAAAAGPSSSSSSSTPASPPLEDALRLGSLWPEVRKLYGHGSELLCCAADHRGRYLASACKAQSQQFAAIWLWRVPTWAPAARLAAHSLSVTQLQFSACDALLLAVSRDRHVAVFGATGREEEPYALIAYISAHQRIIWSGSWAPSCAARCCPLDAAPSAHVFATGSRDKTVKLWRLAPSAACLHAPSLPSCAHASPSPPLPFPPSPVELLAALPPFQQPVTAVAWSPRTAASEGSSLASSSSAPAGASPAPSVGYRSLLAVGLEGGQLELWGADVRQLAAAALTTPGGALAAVERLAVLGEVLRHCAAVQRLVWRWAGGGGRGVAAEADAVEREAKEKESEDIVHSDGTGRIFGSSRSVVHSQHCVKGRMMQLASCSDDHSVRVFNVRIS